MYIIRNLLRYIINTKCCISSSRRQDTRWRVMRYKGGLPPLMIYTTLRAVMIYQAYGNPQSSSSSLRGTPTAAWINKNRTFVGRQMFCFCCQEATKKIFLSFLNKVSNSNGYFFLKLARVTGTVNMSPWEPHHVDVATTQPSCSFISLANFFIPIL